MDSLLTELPGLVQQYGHLLVIAVIGVLVLSGFGLPMPEDLPLMAAGLLAYLGVMSIEVMVPLTFVAVLGADCTLYWLGRRYGHHVPRLPMLRHYLTEERLARAQLAFHNHGGKTLFFGRFLPGLRAPIYFSAGIFKIPFWKMLAFDGSAALLSVPAIVLLAYFFGSQIEKVQHWTEQAQLVVGAAVVLLVVGFVTWKLLRRRRKLAGA